MVGTAEDDGMSSIRAGCAGDLEPGKYDNPVTPARVDHGVDPVDAVVIR